MWDGVSCWELLATGFAEGARKGVHKKINKPQHTALNRDVRKIIIIVIIQMYMYVYIIFTKRYR